MHKGRFQMQIDFLLVFNMETSSLQYKKFIRSKYREMWTQINLNNRILTEWCRGYALSNEARTTKCNKQVANVLMLIIMINIINKSFLIYQT